jgi:hypothetical protein
MADLTVTRSPADVVYQTPFSEVLCKAGDTIVISDPAVAPAVFKSVARTFGGKTYTLTLDVT